MEYAMENPDVNIYPDLLNIPNRVIGKLFPINVSSYVTLPRDNRHRSNAPNDTTNRLQNVINYQNLETNHMNEGVGNVGAVSLCAGCLKNQDQYASTLGKDECEITTSLYPIKYDNMGRRITASGCQLPITMEEDETQKENNDGSVGANIGGDEQINMQSVHGLPSGCDYVSL